jgi:heme-degrading monooxygenase HmoA
VKEATMFAVIFVVRPKPERKDDYLGLAKFLRPKLEAIDGFIDNDRFASQRDPGRMLSLSTWRDEKAVVRWRTQAEHHHVQEKGRFEIFDDYSIWIADYTYDSAPPAGLAVDEKRFDATETGAAKVVTITEFMPKSDLTLAAAPGAPESDGLVDSEVFESIYHPGKLLRLSFWRDPASAEHWVPDTPPDAASSRHRRARIIRAYGMFDRREAPQYYPDVAATARH